jgi:iron-sulfur cluster insertion protein
MQANELSVTDLQLSETARLKMAELIAQVEGEVAGIRIYAQPGGCSGMSFGMTFSEKLEGDDLARDNDGVTLIVASDTIDHLRGAEIDYVDGDNGQASFIFNNVPTPATAGGCGTCGSATSGGGCA